MLQTGILRLNRLFCGRETSLLPSSPYLWPALVVITETPLAVSVLSPPTEDDRVVIQENLETGQSADIPSSVGVLPFQFDPAANTHLIFVAALWQKYDSPGHVVNAGFKAFSTALQSAISDNLINLASSDPETQKQATDNVKSAVKDSVRSAIEDSLSRKEKAKIFFGLLTLDSIVDSSSIVFSSLAPEPFTITIGGSLGSRLLSYGDEGTPGNVSSPVVVGLGGWSDFKFLFAGKDTSGADRIYAVDKDGQLLSFGDAGTPGNVSSPVVVGLGGWLDFKFLFAGKDASGADRIYAVDKDGRLLSYGDAGTPGNVSSPVVVGLGGWLDFKFLFAGKDASGADRIYAVNKDGRLLSYGDAGTPGNVSSPVVVGLGGWLDFKFLFAGKDASGADRIYAVDKDGRLLSYGDAGTPGNVSSPVVVGLGGWLDFKFLFAGKDASGAHRIYAGEKTLTPAHNYEIAGALEVA